MFLIQMEIVQYKNYYLDLKLRKKYFLSKRLMDLISFKISYVKRWKVFFKTANSNFRC